MKENFNLFFILSKLNQASLRRDVKLQMFYSYIIYNQDLMEHFSRMIINFVNNSVFNEILNAKLIDPKYPILQDLSSHILKSNIFRNFPQINFNLRFETISKKSHQYAIKILKSLINSVEIRNYLIRTKLIDNLTSIFMQSYFFFILKLQFS